MSITLEKVVPWGRSLDEYIHMFALSENDLNGQILGCGDGPASFNLEMTKQGRSVTSVDPVYRFSAAEIEQRVRETYQLVVDPLYLSLENYIWERFENPDALGQHRLATMERFLDDYEVGRQSGRYQEQSLPNLSFSNQTFELALCSHFLFLYSEQLSYEFHRDAVVELCRVAKEVRIFPLTDLTCEESAHVRPLMHELSQSGYRVTIQEVPYEFQRGGNRMMRIATQ